MEPLPLSLPLSLSAPLTADPFTLLHLFRAISVLLWSGLLCPHQVESITASCTVTALTFISIHTVHSSDLRGRTQGRLHERCLLSLPNVVHDCILTHLFPSGVIFKCLPGLSMASCFSDLTNAPLVGIHRGQVGGSTDEHFL